ncbi:hypothetical protein Dsin_006467 [Dipteronia sinensis]|uniref:RRM domain-containing protein n=1 Tax=Dipteronia sinensis TaxID=43782 RepID=A0AAE0AZP2_9ROSI|nr:hypothetical protein Dsin_006467 [Dipteronia sinensis]
MRDADGKSKDFEFVNFYDPDDVAHVIEALNGYKFDDKELYIGKAHKKYQREMELKASDKFQGGLNLYLKNLDDIFTDDKLKELFSEFVTITSCKVMRDPNGIS